MAVSFYEWLFGKKPQERPTVAGNILNLGRQAPSTESGTAHGLPQALPFRAITACNTWECPKCRRLFDKGLGPATQVGTNADVISGTTTCLGCGAQFSKSDIYAGVYDFFSASAVPVSPHEKEEKPTYTMTVEDLRTAQRICELFRNYSPENREKIVRVGRDLYANGGYPRMMAVCLYIAKYAEPRTDALGSALDHEWNGIGLWGTLVPSVKVNLPTTLLDTPEHDAITKGVVTSGTPSSVVASAAPRTASNASPLASFDPAAYQGQKQAKGDIHMRVENYRDLQTALKTVPSLDINDPRLPSTVEKTPKPFTKMLREVEFYLGQSSMQGGRITIEVHHGIFPYATDGQWEYEIAKITDDGYLVWSFVHDPTAAVSPLYSGQTCVFRLATDPNYSCGEKAVSLSPEGFCLFHMSKDDTTVISKRVGGVLWETFRKEYEVRFDERIQSGNYDCRGFDVLTSGKMSMCLMGHTFQTAVDFSDGVLRSARFKKSVFQAAARFDRAVFDWDADFGETVFKGEASFTSAKFLHHGGTHPVSFRNAVFEGPVDFFRR